MFIHTKRALSLVLLTATLASAATTTAAKKPEEKKEPLIPAYLEDAGIFTYTAVDEEKSTAADCDAAYNLVGTSTAYVNAWSNVYCWEAPGLYNSKTKTANRLDPAGVKEVLKAEGKELFSTVFGETPEDKCVYQLTVDAGSVLGVKGKGKLDEVAVLTVKGKAAPETTPDIAGCPNPGNYLSYVVSGDLAFVSKYPVKVDKAHKKLTMEYMEGMTELSPGEEEGYLVWGWKPATSEEITCTSPIRVQDGITLGVKPPKAKVPKLR